MSDLANRLKKMAEQEAKGRQAEKDQQNFQQRVNNYISDNARPEYERLLATLKRKIDEVNPRMDALPKFQYETGQQMIGLGNCAAYLMFDKPIINAPNNALMFSIGTAPNTLYFFEHHVQPLFGTDCKPRLQTH